MSAVKGSIIRYYGGKWRLAPWIISHFPPHRIYTEAFGGGASVLLRKERSYGEIYNDLDDELINLFQVLRDHGSELKELLRLTPYARKELLKSYESTDDDLERARRTVVRSYMGFGNNGFIRNTGFRCSIARRGSLPCHDWGNYPDRLDQIINRLKLVIIENKDAFSIIAKHDSPETLHYVDPPYPQSLRSPRDRYRYEMSDWDHERLGALLRNMDGMVVISSYPCRLYDQLYAGWFSVEREALADGARKRTEKLWINEAAFKKLRGEQCVTSSCAPAM